MDGVISAIESRRSVRTFDGNPIDKERENKIREYIQKMDNPFRVPVELKFFDAREYKLSSPVIIGERAYLAGLVPLGPFAEIAYGYTLEKTALFAQRIGLGTVWLGGTFKRENFEKAIGAAEDKLMPCVMPIGTAAKKMSVREALMRKSVKSDTRYPFEKLFFNKSFETPLSEGEAGVFLKPLRMMRLAPSAANKQPWRVVINGGYAHFYKKSDKGFNRGYGDMQKVDMGIGFCHFDLTAKEEGIKGEFIVKVTGIACPKDTEYVISYVVQK